MTLLRKIPEAIRPRILDVYVLKYFASSYLICLFCFIGFYMLIEAFGQLDEYLELDRTLGDVVKAYFVRVPEIFHRLAPYLTLAAAGFTLSRLQKANELAPMKALGVSVYRVLAPVFVAALLLSGLIILDQEVLIPRAETARRRLVLRKKRVIQPQLISDAREGLVMQMDGYDPVARAMQGIRISLFERDRENPRVFRRELGSITAKSGLWDEEAERWVLSDGRRQEYGATGQLEAHPRTGQVKRTKVFGDGEYPLKTYLGPEDVESHDRDIYYLTFLDLQRLYERQKLPHLRVKLHTRVSYPAANLILLFLGLPFFLSSANRSLLIGTGIVALIGFSFFFITFLFMSMGNSGTIPPMTAAWMPSIFFGCLGVALFDKVRS